MAKKSFTSHLQKASESQLETETFVKEHIRIDEELRELIPPLGKEELVQLELNLVAEGVREPLIVWKGEHVLIDGHNRYAIAQAHKLDFKILQKEFPDREAVKSWMINNQLGRRNLTPEQQSYLRGKRYEAEKMVHGGDRKSGPSSSSQNANLKTSDLLAGEYNVSKDTIIRDAKFSRGIDLIGASDQGLKKAILTGEVKVKKSAVQQLADRYGKDNEAQKLEIHSVGDIGRYLQEGRATSENIEPVVGKKEGLDHTSTGENTEGDLKGVADKIKVALDELLKGPSKASLEKLKKLMDRLEGLVH